MCCESHTGNSKWQINFSVASFKKCMGNNNRVIDEFYFLKIWGNSRQPSPNSPLIFDILTSNDKPRCQLTPKFCILLVLKWRFLSHLLTFNILSWYSCEDTQDMIHIHTVMGMQCSSTQSSKQKHRALPSAQQHEYKFMEVKVTKPISSQDTGQQALISRVSFISQ